MKVNVYYGGRGIVGDPTLFVIDKMQEVLEELNVKTSRYNLFEEKKSISSLPNTINEADGIILASTVEWYGIGGYMMEFLDACWLYGNKEKISKTYMCPVVMSTTYGEREGQLNLSVAWEILGGLPCSGICGYIQDSVSFELNRQYITLIEKKAENMYRSISQKIISLPASNKEVRKMVSKPASIELTPQESEQLSIYVSDENYVQTQKEDIRELTSQFKDMMWSLCSEDTSPFIADFKSHFVPQTNFRSTYKFMIREQKKSLIIDIRNDTLDIHYGDLENPSVLCKLKSEVLHDIIEARMTFQRAFMTGDMQVKGDFKILRMLDQVFNFTPNII